MVWFSALLHIKLSRTISCFSSHIALDECDDSDPGRQQTVPEPREEACRMIKGRNKQLTRYR